MRFHLPCVMLAIIALGGCAHTLPSDEATAFRTLATANRESFTGLANSENDAVTAFVTTQVLNGRGSVDYIQCDIAPVRPSATTVPTAVTTAADDPTAEEPQPCTVVWTASDGEAIVLAPTAPKTRALIGSLVGYAEQMATLAEAKDLTEAEASADGVTTAAKTLATTAGVPIAGVVIEAAVWAQKERMLEKRRKALLSAAITVREAVAATAYQMTEISTRLRQNLMMTSLSRAQVAYDVVGQPVTPLADPQARSQHDAQWRAAFADLTAATQGIQTAKDLPTDYDPLRKAHERLITALGTRGASTSEALSDIRTFLALLKAAETAGKGN